MILSVSRVAKSFGVDIVLADATFRIEPREKVALIGRNGTGKTTLLRIITGREAPDAGDVALQRGAKIGYLKQEAAVEAGRTVLEEAQAAREVQLALQTRMRELEAVLEGTPTDDDLAEYALLHEHFLESEGYSAESDVRVVLRRMGFEEDEFDKPTAKLSGGERTRLALARLLLEEPDLLILDEPTNHLDLQATEWLESWIRGYHGAVLLVSHDRTFLENTAERTLELRDGRVKSYPGGFAKYLVLRAEDEARQADLAAKQAHQIAKLDEYVRRFMNSQRTAQARGRLKMKERLEAERVHAPARERGMAGAFGAAQRSGDLVVEAKGLAVGFPGVTLFSGLDWTVRWGERWGVIGENGAGKSTLTKVLLGELDPTAGTVRLGTNLVVGHFRQDGEDLEPDMTPLEFMVWECGMDAGAARDLLGRFLFHGDDVSRPIRTLSGGEKNKLSLARLMNLGPNLLVLDEPTNHLDMDSREALAAMLREYRGTLVLVSHDRWLLAQATDRILDVRRAGPVLYPGSYGEYRARAVASTAAGSVSATPVPEPKREGGLSPRELSKEIGRLERLVAEIEDEVTAREAEVARIEAALADPDPSLDIWELTRGHAAAKERLEGSLSAWEEQSARLASLRDQQG